MAYLRNLKRWLLPFHTGFASTGANPTAGRVLLALFEVDRDCTVDAIVINNGASVAGNVVVGIYGPIPTEETCAGAAVKVQSASTALSGTSQPQTISITATKLKKGRYYVAVEYENAGHTFFRQTNTTQVAGWTQYYDRAGGYGALTDPCPAVTNSATDMPGVRVRSTGV